MDALLNKIMNSQQFDDILNMIVSHKIQEAIDLNLQSVKAIMMEPNMSEVQKEDLEYSAQLHNALEEVQEYFSEPEDIDVTQERYHDFLTRMFQETRASDNVVELFQKK